jgi:hypothetical protein
MEVAESPQLLPNVSRPLFLDAESFSAATGPPRVPAGAFHVGLAPWVVWIEFAKLETISSLAPMAWLCRAPDHIWSLFLETQFQYQFELKKWLPLRLTPGCLDHWPTEPGVFPPWDSYMRFVRNAMALASRREHHWFSLGRAAGRLLAVAKPDDYRPDSPLVRRVLRAAWRIEELVPDIPRLDRVCFDGTDDEYHGWVLAKIRRLLAMAETYLTIYC